MDAGGSALGGLRPLDRRARLWRLRAAIEDDPAAPRRLLTTSRRRLRVRQEAGTAGRPGAPGSGDAVLYLRIYLTVVARCCLFALSSRVGSGTRVRHARSRGREAVAGAPCTWAELAREACPPASGVSSAGAAGTVASGCTYRRWKSSGRGRRAHRDTDSFQRRRSGPPEAGQATAAGRRRCRSPTGRTLWVMRPGGRG